MINRETAKVQVDGFLAEHFASLEKATEHQGESYQRLIGITRDVALAGGKRLRPYMSMLLYEAYKGEESSKILPIAAAQEVMHLAMLVHDDIMDGDLVRHGQPNVTARVLESYEPFIDDETERRRRAEHTALLVGDLLIGEGYALTDDVDGIDAQVMKRTRRLFRGALRTVVGGQLLDSEAPFVGAQASSPRQIAHDKTAHYTFVTPLLVGATLGEAAEEEYEKLREIGEKTGVAYQLRDDILGTFGDVETTGKSIEGDLREGKRTLLAEVFEKSATPKEKLAFEKLQRKARQSTGEPISTRQVQRLLKPARRIVEREIQTARSEVIALIGALAVQGEYRRSLEELVASSLERDH